MKGMWVGRGQDIQTDRQTDTIEVQQMKAQGREGSRSILKLCHFWSFPHRNNAYVFIYPVYRAQLMRERQAREEAERQAQAHADKLRMYEMETEKARKGE